MVLGFHRRIWGISILLALAAAIVMVWLVNRSPMTVCESEVPGSSGEHKFRAVQVVVQPWQGRHQVYGVFMIPERYKHHRLYSVTLTVQGFAAKLSAGSSENRERDNIVPEHGYFIRRAYVPTRTALWLLLTGRFGDLRTPCHWRLVFVDQVQ